jgi:hypothetical protein
MRQITSTKNKHVDETSRVGNLSGKGSRATEPRSRPDPQEGVRLVRAFLNIGNPTLREAVLSLVEDLAVVE